MSRYPTPPQVSAVYADIRRRFMPVIGRWLSDQPRNFRRWYQYYILIAGVDQFTQVVKVHRRDQVYGPSGDAMSFLEYLQDRLALYQVQHSLDTAQVNLVTEDQLPADLRGATWICRLGPQLSHAIEFKQKAAVAANAAV